MVYSRLLGFLRISASNIWLEDWSPNAIQRTNNGRQLPWRSGTETTAPRRHPQVRPALATALCPPPEEEEERQALSTTIVDWTQRHLAQYPMIGTLAMPTPQLSALDGPTITITQRHGLPQQLPWTRAHPCRPWQELWSMAIPIRIGTP
jgi:hypothetical protein